MEISAFARARKFLQYHPVAQWLAIVSSIVTALLFFALVLLLALYIDLVVNRGEVPSLQQLAPVERAAFDFPDATPPEDADSAPVPKKRVHATLESLNLPDAELNEWFNGVHAKQLADRERALLWYVDAIQYLHDAVGEDAAERVRDRLRRNIKQHGLDVALAQPVANVGLLGRVVRSRGTFTGWLTATLAAWNGWTWAGGDERYLLGLFALALVLAAARCGLLFLSNYAAALACLEAVTRCTAPSICTRIALAPRHFIPSARARRSARPIGIWSSSTNRYTAG